MVNNFAMPRKYTTHCVFSMVYIHERSSSLIDPYLINRKCIEMRVCENEDCVKMRLLRKWECMKMGSCENTLLLQKEVRT